MQVYRILLAILLLHCLAQPACAAPVQRCHKVVVAGDSQWVPYTIVVSDKSDASSDITKLSGIGIDLAKKIFTELDIPVVEQEYSDFASMRQAIHNGTIDVIVSTYKYDGIANELQLLHPAYLIDHVTVALPATQSMHIKSWDNLTGLRGVETASFMPDDHTRDLISHYLSINSKDYLLAALQGVINGQYNYIIGSDLQLNYAIKVNEMTGKLLVMKNLFKGGEVYMAVVKSSVCQPYATYMQKRLQDYKNNGTVEKIVGKYIY